MKEIHSRVINEKKIEPVEQRSKCINKGNEAELVASEFIPAEQLSCVNDT